MTVRAQTTVLLMSTACYIALTRTRRADGPAYPTDWEAAAAAADGGAAALKATVTHAAHAAERAAAEEAAAA